MTDKILIKLPVDLFKAGEWVVAVTPPEIAEGIVRQVRLASAADARLLRGQYCRTDADLFREVSAVLQFPLYFGQNWDALDECLSDINEWMPRITHLLLFVVNGEELLCDVDGRYRRIFGRIAKKAADSLRELGVHFRLWIQTRDDQDGEAWREMMSELGIKPVMARDRVP